MMSAMSDQNGSHSGGCLCSAVTYDLPRELVLVLQCHCENCRRISGNFVAAARTDTDTLSITDVDERLQWYDLRYATYGFCNSCGSTLFYRAADSPGTTSVMVGTLNDGSSLVAHEVWFANEAQPHNTLPLGIPHFSGNG